MRYLEKLLIAALLIAGCNQNEQVESNKDPVVNQKKTDTLTKEIAKNNDSVLPKQNDSTLVNISTEILKYLKKKDYQQLAAFVHPSSGIRFSPYGYVDTLHDQKFAATQLSSYGQNRKKIIWGRFDGTGEPINLSIDNYLEKFVYDVDFLNAKQKSVNKIIGAGNSSNNLQSIYPGCDFTEFYFPGINPKYDGMDWKSLKLVFKKENTQYFLVGIIHDQWTI